jgi:hypothetical protein
MLRQRKRSTECNALSRLKIDRLVETENISEKSCTEYFYYERMWNTKRNPIRDLGPV